MSDFITLLILAIALGTDAISVAVAVCMDGVEKKEVIVTSLTVGIFHVVMPLIGLYLGKIASGFFGNLASLVGAIILILLGGNMIRESIKYKKDSPCFDLTGWNLIILALCVSVDSFSVGFGLGTFFSMGTSVVVLTIGVISALMTGAGMIIGKYLGRIIGDNAKIVGGIVLIFIGLKIIFDIVKLKSLVG
ncbi:MAG TPA: manganese efflux pump [Thermoanaerobacterales bacterium]|nr:manganese efflux pump [Thermoanaerobacterales bacterium]